MNAHLINLFAHSGLLKDPRIKNVLLAGGSLMYDPPVPIPNTEVKVHKLDDTWRKPTLGKVEFASLGTFFIRGLTEKSMKKFYFMVNNVHQIAIPCGLFCVCVFSPRKSSF